jgi:hypothetical protein
MSENSGYARRKKSGSQEKTRAGLKKFPLAPKNFFREKFFFLNRGIIIAPHGRRLYTRHHESIA